MNELLPILAAAIGSLSTLAGVRLTWRHQDRNELSAALVQFLAELDAVAVAVRRGMRTPGTVMRMNAWLERRLPFLDALSDELMRATIGRGLARQERDFRVAANRVLLIAPPELKESVVETLQLLQEAQDRDVMWLERWLGTRDCLQVQARAAVGAERRPRRRCAALRLSRRRGA